MTPATLPREISRAFTLLLLSTTVCMVSLAGLAIHTLREIADGQRIHAVSFVPAKRFTAGFEREILNARINFIYFVTIQKPGSLPAGWERYHNAESQLAQMAALIDQHPDLANLRQPLAQLRQDLSNYGVTLAETLSMVQGGELKGPHYDAQVKEWAARGARMVKDAAAVENLTFKSSEGNTNDLAAALRRGQDHALMLLAASFAVCLLLTLLLVRRLKTLLAETAGNQGTPVQAAVPSTPSHSLAATR